MVHPPWVTACGISLWGKNYPRKVRNQLTAAQEVSYDDLKAVRPTVIKNIIDNTKMSETVQHQQKIHVEGANKHLNGV